MPPTDQFDTGPDSRGGWVALLRGINVGGRNQVPMAALRRAFEDAGYSRVTTYIQSGNVLFDSPPPDVPAATLEPAIENLVTDALGLDVMVVARSRAQLRRLIADAPGSFGQQPQVHHSDVVFLKAPLTADAALAAVELREGVDSVWPGDGAVYFQRLTAQRTRSRLSRLMSKPEYKLMTIRNWRTTTTIAALLTGP